MNVKNKVKERKRTKRGNGEGCISKTSKGYWEARITDGYNADGSQHFKTFGGKSRAIVCQKLNEFIANRDKFNPEIVVKYTVKEWLNLWYESYVIDNVRTSTRVSYEGIINNHLIPNIGYIKLLKLKKTDIEDMYRKLINIKGLSVKTVKNVHLVLHKALQEAFEREYIPRNIADISKVPTMKSLNQKKKEIEIYSLSEQKNLEKVAMQDKVYGYVVIMALYSGMRKGEILGLQWNDIDFKNKQININKQVSRLKDYSENAKSKTKLGIEYYTKTNNSTRKIPLSNNLVFILKQLKKFQEENRKMFGNLYYDYNMVFCRKDGYYLDPDTVLDKYKKLADKANIKKCTFHALRHTFATRALESGIDIKVASNILGHYSVQFTLDTYAHVLLENRNSAMQKFDNYLNELVV